MKRYKDLFAVIFVVGLLFCACADIEQSIQSDISTSKHQSSDISHQSSRTGAEALSDAPALPASDDEQLLKTFIESTATGEIVFWSYGDYDLDGNSEAFAFAGTKPDEYNASRGSLWFVSIHGAVELVSDAVYDEIASFTVADNTKYVYAQLSQALNRTVVLGVKNGKPYETPVSNIGIQFTPSNNYSEFTLVHSVYDITEDGEGHPFGGHSYKPYYFYYENDFHEYGGTEISLDELKKYAGADKALAEIEAEEGVVRTIYKRKNGIINITYAVKDKDALQEIYHFYNINLKLENNAVEMLEKHAGKYLPALIPEIATY